MNEVGEGNTIAHDAAPRDQHAYGSWPLKHRQCFSGSTDLYGLKTNIRQHVSCDHTDELVGFRDKDG
jgi:hypothetical protein